MQVMVAESAGFCYGVKRAVDMARETAKKCRHSVMLGSIIHNANVVAELEALGMRKVDSWDQVRPGETVVIRSHGERKEVFERLAAMGAACVNATCPNVLHSAAGGEGPGGGENAPDYRGDAPSGGTGGGQLVGAVGDSAGAPGAGKLAQRGAFPPEYAPYSDGSNHLCTGNLGKFQRNFKKTVYKCKNI